MTADDVFIGNGVSELIDLVLRALLNEGDEVLVPSPDYPLWTAATTLNGGKVVHYPCRPENNFIPDPEEIAALVTKKTRAIVVINPNNPTGAVYPRAVLESIARLAERLGPRRVQRRDLRPDDLRRERVHPDGHAGEGHAVRHAVRPLEGLSRLRLPRGLGVVRRPQERRLEYFAALELLSSLRLCSNVPAQWAVQTALGGYQSIKDLVTPGGRLFESRRAIANAGGVEPLPGRAADVGARCTRSLA